MCSQSDDVSNCSNLSPESSAFNVTLNLLEGQPMLMYICAYLNTYYLPVIIIFGIIGNGLSATVFLSAKMRSRSSSYYLAALAISDLIFLVCLLFTYIATFGIDLYNRNVFCQIFAYLSSVCTFLSAWLIVTFTVERFIAIQYPLHRPHMCTVRRAKIIVLGLVLFTLAYHIYLLFMAGVIQLDSQVDMCHFKPEYTNGMKVINVLDTIVAMLLPVIFIVVMNTMIAVQIQKFSRSHTKKNVENRVQDSTTTFMSQSRKDHKSSSSQDDAKEGKILPLQQLNKGSKAGSHLREVSSGSSQRSSNITSTSKLLCQRTQQNITKMLLLVSTTFIFLTLPSYVLRLYGFAREDHAKLEELFTVRILQDYALLLFYTNFAVNFLLYSTYGFTFRRVLASLIQNLIKGTCFKKNLHVTYECMVSKIHTFKSRLAQPDYF